MGMYTELILGCELSKDTPKILVDALELAINRDSNGELKNGIISNIPITTPTKELEKFDSEYELMYLLYSSSYYFGCSTSSRVFYRDRCSGNYVLSIRGNSKNYSKQIEKFLEYIKPFITKGSGYPHNVYAYVQYEENAFPHIYAMDGEYDVLSKETEEKLISQDDELYKMYCKLSTLVPENEIEGETYRERAISMINYLTNDKKEG